MSCLPCSDIVDHVVWGFKKCVF